METRLFYMVEDDYNVSSLYPSKEKWLESLRYNLDVAVEYEDITLVESNTIFKQAKEELYNKLIETNGFYYSIQEVRIIFTSKDVIVRYVDYNNEVLIYTFNGESYDIQEEDVISAWYDEEQIKVVLKKFIKEPYFDYGKLAIEVKNVLGG